MIEGKKVALSEETVKEFKSKFIKGAFQPSYDDVYYYLDNENLRCSDLWEDSITDTTRLNGGNVFFSDTEAKIEQKRRSALQRIKKFIWENDLEFVPDWNNTEQKFNIYYDQSDESFNYVSWNWSNYDSNFYFKSETDAQKVIDNCEKDLKVIFNVK